MTQPPPPNSQTAQHLAEAAALVYTYQATTQKLRDQLTGFLTALWRSLGTYRNAQMGQFVSQAVPVVTGAQQQMASLTAAYLAQHQATALGSPFRPAAVDPAKVTGAAARNGTDPAEVYGRPFHLVWRQLADLPNEPGSIEKAIQAGEDRAVQTGLTDLQLTKVRTSQDVLTHDPRVTGYRRVLEGAYSCALCVVAASGRYHKAQLAAIHPACDCSVSPIYGAHDPWQGPDDAALTAAHAAIADQFGHSSSAARLIPGGDGTQYRDVLITHDHGELGPVLGIRGRPFTGPNDLG
jgi:hypothetical protein